MYSTTLENKTEASSGITVTPSIASIDLKTDKPIVELIYKNSTTTEIELDLSARDFKDLSEGYKVQILDDNDAKNYKYSLSSWITFENSVVLLQPGESKTTKIFIDQSRLSPGGHYASIQAEIKQSRITKENVSIKGILSSLLFVRASTGKEIEEMNIEDATKGNGLFFPTDITIQLKNSGNVELSPYGLIEVYNPFNKIVSKGYMNQGSNITLPETLRSYSVPLIKPNGILLPGYYEVKITIRYGKTDRQITKTIKFFSYGSNGFIAASVTSLIILIGVGVLIFKKKKNDLGPMY